MIRGLLARPGAGPGSRTVIPGPVRLTRLPGSLQAGACRGPNLGANPGCRGTRRVDRRRRRQRPAPPALVHHRAQTRLPGCAQRPDLSTVPARSKAASTGSFCGIRIVKSTPRDFARRVREFRDEKAE